MAIYFLPGMLLIIMMMTKWQICVRHTNIVQCRPTCNGGSEMYLTCTFIELRQHRQDLKQNIGKPTQIRLTDKFLLIEISRCELHTVSSTARRPRVWDSWSTAAVAIVPEGLNNSIDRVHVSPFSSTRWWSRFSRIRRQNYNLPSGFSYSPPSISIADLSFKCVIPALRASFVAFIHSPCKSLLSQGFGCRSSDFQLRNECWIWRQVFSRRPSKWEEIFLLAHQDFIRYLANRRIRCSQN